MKSKHTFLGLILSLITTSVIATTISPLNYTERNEANVSFDVSMPVDATGYTLKGKNLLGGIIKFTDTGLYIAPLLAHEKGRFQLPIVKNLKGQTLIKTNIGYDVIKFINPNGLNNFFIKVGMGTRKEKVAGLDPSVLKKGEYIWQAPIFSVGKESDTVNHQSTNIQLMQVGSLHGGPGSANAIYTQNFYLYAKAMGNRSIVGHPIKSARLKEILQKPYTTHFSCRAQGLWGGGGSDGKIADPYRTITGECKGTTQTFPAGPNLDYEYGSFTLPTVKTPWNAMPSDRCYFPGEKKMRSGCTNASLKLNFKYMAQKIRVPINKSISIFAESGTVYRTIKPSNLRYICNSNVYLNNILAKEDCLKKSYLQGSASYPYFAVGYEVKNKDGALSEARYINIPGQENGNKLAWIDASNTYVYAISGGTKKELLNALNIIKKENKTFYDVVGKTFFMPILKERVRGLLI